MIESRTYEKPRSVGRRKEFSERITLPLAEGTTARLDGLLEDGEDRVSLIRKAIDAEAKRRERTKPKS